jgi:spectrin beta
METLSLVGASVDVATDYTKKEHVFRIKLSNGGQYLFRAKDNPEMNAWIGRTREGINSSGGQTSGQSSIDKTKSLPPPDKQQRSTSSLSGPGGPSASLKPFKK